MNDLEKQWFALDQEIRKWWEDDLGRANEKEIRDPELNKIWYSDEEHKKQESRESEENEGTLLYLPFPYVSAGGSEGSFPEMYCWDVYFTNLALAAHSRYDIIKYHILNHLFMIERYGMVLNGNRNYYLGRSQTPIHHLSVKLYFEHTQDRDMVARAYPVLKKEYTEYWMARHHTTPTGLATNRDLSDPACPEEHYRLEQHGDRLRPELAAEAESLDFTAIYNGDIRKCNPLMTNCALTLYAKTLSWMAGEIGWQQEAESWQQEAERRAEKIRELCWNEEKGFFFEYQFEEEKQLPFWSLSGYWAMWAGVATKEQATKMVKNLARFEQHYGLPQTDRAYPSPHPEFNALQWDYPNSWPPSQIVVVNALEAYGYNDEALRLAHKYVSLQVNVYQETGRLWERYNAVDGNIDLPRERYSVVPMHGWSSASAVYLGRKIFPSKIT